jgi:hypothetical protein
MVILLVHLPRPQNHPLFVEFSALVMQEHRIHVSGQPAATPTNSNRALKREAQPHFKYLK